MDKQAILDIFTKYAKDYYLDNGWYIDIDQHGGEIAEEILTAYKGEGAYTDNPVCPRCAADCVQNLDGDWICDCHTAHEGEGHPADDSSHRVAYLEGFRDAALMIEEYSKKLLFTGVRGLRNTHEGDKEEQ